MQKVSSGSTRSLGIFGSIEFWAIARSSHEWPISCVTMNFLSRWSPVVQAPLPSDAFAGAPVVMVTVEIPCANVYGPIPKCADEQFAPFVPHVAHSFRRISLSVRP